MCIFFGHILFYLLQYFRALKVSLTLFSFEIQEPNYQNKCSKFFTIKSFLQLTGIIYTYSPLSLFPSLFVWVFLNLVLPLKAQQLVKDQLGKTPDKVKYLYYKFPLTIERKRQNILIPKHALLIGRQFCELCFGLWRRDGEYLKAFPFRNFRARKMLILIY